MKRQSGNFFKYTNNSLVPYEDPAGGDFFEQSLDRDIISTESPREHPFFELDSQGAIVPKLPREIQSYYQNLFTPLYRAKPKFMDWSLAFMSKIFDPFNLADELSAAFNLDRAVGNQLDILGGVAGIKRTVDFVFSDGSNSVLDDDFYRIIVKAKIAKNLWDGKINSLQPIWSVLFPTTSLFIRDNQDMTMDVFLFGPASVRMKELVEHGYIVPKPQTVRLKSVIYVSHLPAFGFWQDDAYISGFDRGYWIIAEQDKPWFGFDQDDNSISGFDKGIWNIPEALFFGFDEEIGISGFDAGVWYI